MDNILNIFWVVVGLCIIILSIREIICWYWKINLFVEKYDQMILLLKEIRDNVGP